MEKGSEITEDDRKNGEDLIQKATDKAIAKIDECVDRKSKEIMTV
jgi:ribosome recycling factor